MGRDPIGRHLVGKHLMGNHLVGRCFIGKLARLGIETTQDGGEGTRGREDQSGISAQIRVSSKIVPSNV
jgi:hypothetical protein